MGMVREYTKPIPPLDGFPHACGDGPRNGLSGDRQAPFSPRVWGWSAFSIWCALRRNVFPTRVGMVRIQSAVFQKRRGFPHACGDGPHNCRHEHEQEEFSPRVWGWSASTYSNWPFGEVFPTRVGMVRLNFRVSLARSTFSPRVWGWSVGEHHRPAHTEVFPTRVGMVRDWRIVHIDPLSFRHACGDGPFIKTSKLLKPFQFDRHR